MVQGYVGLPGTGKTYWLAKTGLDAIKKGRDVYANFHLDGAKYFNRLDQIKAVRKGVILIDEINLSVPSRMWNKLPSWLLYFWSQTRKFDLDIYWTAQSLARVDKVVREISNFVWQFKNFFFGFHVANKYLPEEMDKAKRMSFETKWFTIDKKVYEHYNTYEIIEIQEEFLKS